MPSISKPPQARLVLALDTSSSLGSVALARGGSVLAHLAYEAGRSHSQQLLPTIERVFEQVGVSVGAVDLFAVVVGPGSFTGLRVSLASLRGLAGGKPCFGALATDVAAWAARGRGANILALTDLFHGEVFGSLYDADATLISPRESGGLTSVLAALRGGINGPTLVVGSAAHKHRAEIEGALTDIAFVPIDEGLAPHLCHLALARATPENICAPSDLLPFYLRDPLTRGLLNAGAKGS